MLISDITDIVDITHPVGAFTPDGPPPELARCIEQARDHVRTAAAALDSKSLVPNDARKRAASAALAAQVALAEALEYEEPHEALTEALEAYRELVDITKVLERPLDPGVTPRPPAGSGAMFGTALGRLERATDLLGKDGFVGFA